MCVLLTLQATVVVFPFSPLCVVVLGGGAAVSSCTLATSNSVPTKTEAMPIHQATMVDPRSTNSSGLPASWGSDYHVPLPVSRGFMHCNFSPHSDVAEASATSSVSYSRIEMIPFVENNQICVIGNKLKTNKRGI